MRLLFAAVVAIPLGLDLFLPAPESNPLAAENIALGRRLFFDRRLSRDASISCASCHDPERAFSDGRAKAIGIGGREGRRHSPALINRGYGRAFFWDGRTASLEEQVLKPIQDPNEMDFTPAEAAARMNLDVATLSRALASYVRSILSGDAPFDRYVNGDRSALSEEQQLGLRLFRGKGNCTACHIGPNFTDEQFHNTGVAWRERSSSVSDHRAAGAGLSREGSRHEAAPTTELTPTYRREEQAVSEGWFVDEGRFAVSKNPRDRGAFKTPTLREVARTAPYMHDGSLPTLEAVIDFYSVGGRPNPSIDSDLRPANFSPEEKRALVAFLESLSGRISETGKR